ncbi:hypothetical protein JD969_17355 [Planctomycetota bacterium]|nr:hypothetical protein JD969_17355 [Planctomycetota bacterium]
MSSKSHNSQRLLMFAVFVLAISSLLPASFAGRVSFVPKAIVNFVLIPTTTILHGFSSSVRPPKTLPAANINTFEQLQAEYAAATALIRQLQFESERLRDENDQLRRYHELNGSANSLHIVRTQVSGSTQPPNPTLLISKGANHGIAIGNVAFLDGKLVGSIRFTTPLTAEIKLINSQAVQLPVVFKPTVGDIPEGSEEQYDLTLNTEDDGQTFFAQIDKDSPVEIGFWAHLYDRYNQYWPTEAKGLIVGQIIDIIPDPTNPYLVNRAIIKPTIELQRLREVDILVPDQN